MHALKELYFLMLSFLHEKELPTKQMFTYWMQVSKNIYKAGSSKLPTQNYLMNYKNSLYVDIPVF